MSEVRRSSDGVQLGPRVPDGRSYDERQIAEPARPEPRIYYQDDAVTLWLGDCRDVLPTLGPIDHVITDPQYSEHVHKSVRRGLTAHAGVFSERSDLGFDPLTPELMAFCGEQFGRLARRWIAVFSDTESSHLWAAAIRAEYVRTAFWRKDGGAPQFTGDRPAVACEAITLCHRKGRKRWNGGGKQGFYDVPIVVSRGGPNEVRQHTTQKPEKLMLSLIADFTDPGDVILDAFGGSGTTAVAAKRLGRRAIVIEKKEQYAEVAARRLSQGALNLEFVS